MSGTNMMSHALEIRNPYWWSGIALAVAVAVTSGVAADWVGESLLGFDRSPVSDIMLAIAIGMLVANTISFPAPVAGGLRFCASTVLRFGIMLLGVRLSLVEAGWFTIVALPFVLSAIAIGLLTVHRLGRHLGLSPQLSGLIAVGTSICGCSAIVATAPLIKSNEAEVSYAVACITAFGLAAMFLHPYVAHFMFAEQPALAGLFLGTSIHDTAQVTGAGLMYEARYNSPVALDIATVTKLTRTLCMIAVVPLVGALYSARPPGSGAEKVKWRALVPWFIVGFAAMSALRTTGDAGDKAFGFLDPAVWNQLVSLVRATAEQCLLIAMAAVGLTSMLGGIVKIGLRPFALGLFAALLIGGTSLTLIHFFADDLIGLVGL
jgi:uncharacterized integral membrane protein (TIGR00698 family)